VQVVKGFVDSLLHKVILVDVAISLLQLLSEVVVDILVIICKVVQAAIIQAAVVEMVAQVEVPFQMVPGAMEECLGE
jgi:hypothetical protein